MGLILDSSILIAAERQKQTITQLIEQIVSRTGNGETALSAIGLTEMAHAVHRAPTGQLRALHQNFLEDVLATFEVYPYTADTALLAGRIDAQQRTSGITVPFPDLLIGCTALSLGFSVLTHNLRHFRLIPGLRHPHLALQSHS